MKRILLTILLIPLALFGQTRDPVVVDTNGVVRFPSNFFGINAASNAVALASYFQAANANLTALAALAPSNGDVPFWTNGAWSTKASASIGGSGGLADAPSDGAVYVRKNAAWISATTRVAYGITDAQPLDADLTALAALTPSNGDMAFWTNGSWSLKNVSTIGGAGGGISDAPSDGTRYLRLNAAWTALDADLQRLADITGATGAMIYRDATGWTNRAAGTNGQVLTMVGGVPDWANSGAGSTFSVNGSVVSSPNLVNNWANKISNASGTLTLTQADPVTLAYAATLNPNMTNGVTFRVTLTGDATLGAPTNPVDNQPIRVEAKQDATGGRLLTVDTTYWWLPEEIPSTFTLTNANAITVILGRYDSTAAKVRFEGTLTYR